MLLEATRAPPGTDVLEDGSGDRVRVGRGEGWLYAVLESSRGPDSGVQLWQVEALGERPAGLPPEVPFLADVPGLVVRCAEGVLGLWPWWGQGPSMLEPLTLGLDPGADVVPRFGSTEAGEILDGVLAAGFERLASDAMAEGWEIDAEQFTGPPFPSRQLQMRLGERARLVTLSGGRTGGEVVLVETSASTRPPSSYAPSV